MRAANQNKQTQKNICEMLGVAIFESSLSFFIASHISSTSHLLGVIYTFWTAPKIFDMSGGKSSAIYFYQ